MRNAGFLPLKKNWQEEFDPAPENMGRSAAAIPVPREKEYPDIYYAFRARLNDLRRIPGCHSFALDFSYLLSVS